MNETHSDAFVFFGATGDLAFKKIFPSLQAMAGRGHLNVPVIGIGRSAPDLAAFKDRARESLEKRGGLDPAAFDKLMTRTMFVDITERVLMEQEKARLEAQNNYLQEEIRSEHNFGEIVGSSPALLDVLRQVEQIARIDSTVLIH